MDRIPLRSGDFVWTLFPYDTELDSPGPIRHAACVIAAFNQRDAGIATMAPVQSRGLVVGVFTSSQIQKFGDTLPIGVIAVTAKGYADGRPNAIFHRRPQACIHTVHAPVFP